MTTAQALTAIVQALIDETAKGPDNLVTLPGLLEEVPMLDVVHQAIREADEKTLEAIFGAIVVGCSDGADPVMVRDDCRSVLTTLFRDYGKRLIEANEGLVVQ